jgi:hypothetical protein
LWWLAHASPCCRTQLLAHALGQNAARLSHRLCGLLHWFTQLLEYGRLNARQKLKVRVRGGLELR